MNFKDRVYETTTDNGFTSPITLLGPEFGLQSFATAYPNGTRVPYTIEGGGEWEVGEGIYNAGTLTRDNILASSNGGLIVNFLAGTKGVFVTIPGFNVGDMGFTMAFANRTVPQ